MSSERRSEGVKAGVDCGMAVTRRLARRSDLPAIVGIYNSTIPSRMVTADTEPVTVESRLPWFEAHSSPARPLWIAELDGKVAAWLSISTFYGRPAYDKTVEVSVYVHEECRRRGVGAYLLSEAIAHAPAIGVETLLGFIFAHNLSSLRLFERFGFAQWGRLPQVAELDGVARDVVIVGRRA